MFARSQVRVLGIMASLGIGMLLSSPVAASTNLLTNPGAESNGTGWTTIQNGGNGMSYNFDGVVYSGTKSFQTSHGLDSISQTVDLFTNGYRAGEMDDMPNIRLGVWLTSRPDQGAQYYVKFSLIATDGTTEVVSQSYGSPSSLVQLAGGSGWSEINHTFSNYGTGVRYVKIEFGGRDQSTWGGNYGIHFDDASVAVTPRTITGGFTMPSTGYLPPAGPFILTVNGSGAASNGNGVLANMPTVNLNLTASADVNRMALSRYEDFRDASIVPFAASVPWSVCGASVCDPGTYHVYIKFYQAYGVTSPVQKLTIKYAPSVAVADVQNASLLNSTSTTKIPSTEADTAKAPRFTRNLRQGDRGEDVKRLQQFLNTNGFLVAKTGMGSPGKESPVFGPALQRALARFQEAHPETLLTPFGLKKGTGIFGTQTRLLINQQ